MNEETYCSFVTKILNLIINYEFNMIITYLNINKLISIMRLFQWRKRLELRQRHWIEMEYLFRSEEKYVSGV